MKPYRSMLFVPGQKPSWVDKGVAAGADALILDLEDSVPSGMKDEARAAVAAVIADKGAEAALGVRPNPLGGGLLGAGLRAAVPPGLPGPFLPKAFPGLVIVRLDALG